MASSEDPRLHLKKLAVNHMKSSLHARFLQNCINDDIVPKGLRISLKVSVGNDSAELQSDIDALLQKVSVEICERIRADHLRRAHSIEQSIEDLRKSLQHELSNNDFNTMENDIFKETEEKQILLNKTHEKKLNILRNEQIKYKQKEVKKAIRGEKTSTINFCSTKIQTKSTVDTDHNEGWHTVARKQKLPKQQSALNQKRDTGNVFVQKAQVKQNRIETPEKNSTTTILNPGKESSICSDTKSTSSKNERTPGTKMSYREAVINGATKTTLMKEHETSLIHTMEILIKTMKDLIVKSNQKQDVLQNLKTEGSTRNFRKERNTFSRVRKQF
ncbi:hypothetical protein DPMN_020401 [Dreissena polymorpha]|uniref:Uncharacterized protein n=1 Tax=Dreissena polymorpha TaxID=45954 RepID=A0A9D4NGR2_DREPO|nr:hypothetical protein DPMN_020400 [Dreissena polymorpha]KAH3896228.1 hypothetical protein DPMN_020401 [Dreissena polymorpha]